MPHRRLGLVVTLVTPLLVLFATSSCGDIPSSSLSPDAPDPSKGKALGNSKAAQVAVTLSPTSLTPTHTAQATAVAHDNSGKTISGSSVSWSSSDTSVATVSSGGMVRGVTAGSAAITATIDGVTGSAPVTVANVVAARVQVTIDSSSLAAPHQAQATAVTFDSTGATISAPVSWASSDITIATVTSTGLITAVSPGTAVISGTSNGGRGSAGITIVPGPPTQLVLRVQPVGGQSGTVLVTQPVVQIGDANGQLVPMSATVTASIQNGSGTLSGTTAVTAVNGVATFANLAITGSGSFTLHFFASGLTPVTSNYLGVVGTTTPATTPTQATALGLSVMPVGGVSGTALGTQPVVQLRDANNNLVTTATGTVTAAIASGSGTLSGTTAVNAINGVATFTNLVVTGTGSYTLHFTASGLTPATSNSFTMTASAPPPSATQLGVSVQPTGGVSGTALAAQPIVQLRDVNNNLVSSATGNVTASIASGSGTLSGTTVVNAVNGVATFTNLVVTGTGSYTLRFTASGLTSATSSSFTMTTSAPPPSASQLGVSVQPVGGVSGTALGAQPVVQLRNASGQLVSTATGSVTAAIASGAGTLSGTTVVNAVNGVATFTNLVVTGTGSYTLRFTASGLTSATSSSFTMTTSAPPPSATQLGVSVQPVGGVSGTALGTQPVVQLRNASGQLVSSATGSVTAAIASGTGTLSGTTVVNAVNGVATFTNLAITGSGSYTLSFTSSGLTSVTSNSIAMTASGGSGGSSGSSAEPTPSGTIVFDSRAGGAQSFQSANSISDVRAYFTKDQGQGAGELVDGSHGHWDFTTNYDGNGKHALRIDWTANPGTESEASSIFYYPTSINQLYWTVTIHLGQTATGGGLGTVGSFVPVTTGGGMKRLLFLRNKDDGTDRTYWVWQTSSPSAPESSISIDNRNFNDYFQVDLGVGVDVRWTGRIVPASSPTSSDGVVQVWRNGVLVVDDHAAAIGNLPFSEKEMAATRFNTTQNESEYWTDLVVWRP